MNVFIIAALTADGFIAENSTHSPMNWTSKEDKQRFVSLTKKAGVVVMGSKTFSTFPKPLKERLNIIYTRDPGSTAKKYDTYENLEFTDEHPTKLIERLKNKGFSSVAICGGTEIYTKFLTEGVINKLYLTIEPVIFGAGVTLFNKNTPYSLEMVSLEKTDTGTIFIEYNVK